MAASDPIALKLAQKQKEISVAEFFERNKQLLGFDTPTRSIITAVKEAIDNSLDACEEANVLPDIYLEIRRYEDSKDDFVMIVEDNGPGITKTQLPNIFGRLLYGSRFHAIRQARGQQGIGISAAVMYGQLTTGKPARVVSKIGPEEPAYEMELILDTKKNRPDVVSRNVVLWEKDHGTRVEITMRGRYVKNQKQSIYEYVRATAVVNPHASIMFKEPDGSITAFKRVTEAMPEKTSEIKPHPLGIELGALLQMAKNTESYKLTSFLVNEFSRVSYRTAREICAAAGLEGDLRPKKMQIEDAKALLDAFQKVKIMAPSTECLSPIGDILLKKGLKNVLDGMRPSFYSPPVSREPSVYAGHPFQVECGLVFGGELPKDSHVDILRYANRVPLLYQQGGCVITKAIESIDWRNYGLEQRGGRGIPVGPAVIMVHVASTKIPFTSESKEAIADIPEIQKEIENALRLCGRKLKTHMNKSARREKASEKFEIVLKVLPKLAEKSAKVVGKPVPSLDSVVAKIMDIVYFEDNVEYVEGFHKVTISVTNFTEKSKKFKIYLVLPMDVKRVFPGEKPKDNLESKVVWEVGKLTPLEKKEFTVALEGMDRDEYDENEFYMEGIDPVRVLGAEPWLGVE